jgi:phosphatidylglycerophosphate synthase
MIIIALRGKRSFRPVLAGKASTICQVFLMYFVLYLNAAGKSPQALSWLYVLTALLTAASFVQYGFIGVRMFRRQREETAG